ERLSGQPFVEEPDAARIAPCPSRAHERLHVGRADGEEEALEDGEGQALVLQCEGQGPFESGFGLIAGRVKTPFGRVDGPVTATDGREPARYRNGRPMRAGKEGVDQGSVADRSGLFG